MPVFPEWLYHEFMDQYFLGGSQVTCDPPPTENTDYDWFILVKEGYWEAITRTLIEHGYVPDNGYHRPFLSFKEADDFAFQPTTELPINFVLTLQPVWYEKMKLSTKVCKRLNLLDKEDRKLVFHAIVFNEDIEAERVMNND
jgi:hypothetical protein